MKDKDYEADSERYKQLMALYRTLKLQAQLLKQMESRTWKGVDVSAAKVLREARRLMKALKNKRVKR